MVAGSSVVKLTAKTALKNYWLSSVIACLTVVFSYFISALSIGYIAEVAGDIAAYLLLGIIAFFMLAPLLLGVIRFFWRLIFGADDKPLSVFYWFSDGLKYKRALKLIAALALRALLFGLILFLPALIVDFFTGGTFYELFDLSIPLWTENLYYLSIFLKTIATVLLLFIMAKYYLAPFLIIADENMEIDEAVHMSSVIAKNTMLDYIYLIFSFFGWFIISVLVFPLVFTMPYFITSLSVHARFAIADYNKKADIINQSSFPTFSVEI